VTRDDTTIGAVTWPYKLRGAAFAHGKWVGDSSIPTTIENRLRPFVRGKLGPEMKVWTSDGGVAEFAILKDGIGFSVKSSNGGEVGDLIYRCAHAANLVILSRRIPVALTRRDQLEHLPPGFDEPVLIESGDELVRLIEHDGFTYKQCRGRLST
jgi:hypothetical protein